MTDLIITENWPRSHGGDRHPRTCRCPRCRSVEGLASEALFETFEDGLFEANTPGGRVSLPGQFSGWMHPIRLSALRSASQTRYIGPSNRLLYRIRQRGVARPLYIGEIRQSTRSLRERIKEHCQGTPFSFGTSALRSIPSWRVGESQALKRYLQNLSTAGVTADQILVDQGRISGLPNRLSWRGLPHVKVLHAFELALQVLENPRSYRRNTEADETLSQLRKAHVY